MIRFVTCCGFKLLSNYLKTSAAINGDISISNEKIFDAKPK